MKYYVIPVVMLNDHGMGDESWRKTRDGEALSNEGEVTGKMGYPSSTAFEDATGIAPMTLKEATEWIKDK